MNNRALVGRHCRHRFWLASLAAALASVAACGGPEAAPGAPKLRFAPVSPPAFARVLAPPDIELPRDHGPHYDYQTEWWYYTGHLEATDGRRFGYQLTFFRRGLTPGPPPEGPGLRTNQFLFAHLALTDVAGGTHRFFERSSRGAAGLAGAQAAPFRVWLDAWEVTAEDAAGRSIRLRAVDAGIGLDLKLVATKPLVRHGDRGLSPKSATPGNASVYIGYTRLATEGTLSLDDRDHAVRGESWFDHEWSTSALGAGAVGWDWFSLQLDDGRELMLFEIRRGDGSREPVSSGTLVAADGAAQHLARDDFEVAVLERWRSPHTAAEYPAGWRVRVPGHALDLGLRPLVPDQELHTSFTYWEGAVTVDGAADGQPVAGRGYVELTGYARSMEGVF